MNLLPLVLAALLQTLTYSRGQNISPAYEGWEQQADGVKYFVFGYMNRNWEEEIDVPIGADNGFSVGGDRGAGAPGLTPDQGQPTHFLPRRNRFVFKVRVPATFTVKDELVWTLTSHGKTEKAYATLRPDYVLDDVVKASETGALGAGTSSPEVRSNQPPTVRIVETNTRKVKAWEDTRVGLNSPWAPAWQPTPIPADGRQPVTVTFSEPGTYVLRCRADDGALVADDEVTIVVTK